MPFSLRLFGAAPAALERFADERDVPGFALPNDLTPSEISALALARSNDAKRLFCKP